MLKVDSLHASSYLRYVSQGSSDVSSKSPFDRLPACDNQLMEWRAVKNDTFRTLATDTQFKGKVKEDMLVRLLEAFVWKNKSRGGSLPPPV